MPNVKKLSGRDTRSLVMHRKLSVVLLEEELRDDYGHIFMFALVVSHCKHNDDALPPLTGKDNTVLTNKFNGNELNYSVQRCHMSSDGFQCGKFC
jgi:hypothetical protein